MRTVLIIVILVMAAVAVIYFSSDAPPQNDFSSEVLGSSAYPGAAMDLAAKIGDLSPTPPTEDRWTVREVEFVKNEPYAYVDYHDTHNLFRILVETGQNRTYRVIASFEATQTGWKVIGGEDLAKGKETVKISPN